MYYQRDTLGTNVHTCLKRLLQVSNKNKGHYDEVPYNGCIRDFQGNMSESDLDRAIFVLFQYALSN